MMAIHPGLHVRPQKLHEPNRLHARIHDPKKSNKEGSLMSFMTQWIEGHLLLAALRVMRGLGLPFYTLLMFEGFRAMKRDGIDVNTRCEALRDECERS